MRPRHLMLMVLPFVCVAVLLAVAHAQPTSQAAVGVSPAGRSGVPQPGATAIAAPPDPLRDPILLRNCQAEYLESTASATPQGAQAAGRDSYLLLKKLECKVDQANRKLDYVLNLNVSRR